MKTQPIRLLDVFFLGPVMLWAGLQKTSLPQFARSTLMIGGIATIVYNWRNYRIENLATNAPEYFEYRIVRPDGTVELWRIDRQDLFAIPQRIEG